MKYPHFWKQSSLAALALIMVIGLFAALPWTSAGAAPGAPSTDSLSIGDPNGGAFIRVTYLGPDFRCWLRAILRREDGVDQCPRRLDFLYGWKNSTTFTSPPVGYWIGVYDVTDSTYVWAGDHELSGPAPRVLLLRSINESSLISGHQYYINFFIRDSYGPPATNVVVLTLSLTAP